VCGPNQIIRYSAYMLPGTNLNCLLGKIEGVDKTKCLYRPFFIYIYFVNRVISQHKMCMWKGIARQISHNCQQHATIIASQQQPPLSPPRLVGLCISLFIISAWHTERSIWPAKWYVLSSVCGGSRSRLILISPSTCNACVDKQF
jgi:hypothetical protein